MPIPSQGSIKKIVLLSFSSMIMSSFAVSNSAISENASLQMVTNAVEHYNAVMMQQLIVP